MGVWNSQAKNLGWVLNYMEKPSNCTQGNLRVVKSGWSVVGTCTYLCGDGCLYTLIHSYVILTEFFGQTYSDIVKHIHFSVSVNS